MRSLLFLTVFTISSFYANAQVDSLLNSGKSISKAAQLYDSGKYEYAIRELKRIDPRDTNYVYSLSELVKAYYENKQYEEALDASLQGLKVPSSYRADLFHSLALVYNRQGKLDLAQSTLTDGLKEFPFDYALTYRIGIFLYGQKRFDEAEAQFFKTLDLAPFHLGSHLYLSKIAMLRGNKVKGMLSMGIYLVLNNKENTQLQVLENFVKNELTDENTIPQGSSVNPFSRLDEILRAKISFDEQYKTNIPIDLGIVRQYQLLFNQIKEQKFTGNSPWLTFYLTIYKDLINAESQEPFVYYLLQSSSIKEAKQWAGKNEKALQKFYTAANTSLKQFRKTRTLSGKWGYMNPVACQYFDNGDLQSLGDSDQSGNRIGKWYYYYTNGQEQAEGNYNQGKKVGTWTYIDNSGAVTSQENQDNGEIKIFNREGIMERHYFLKGKNIDGPYELFYPCGALNESRNYKDGKRDGPGKGYSPNGKPESEFVFKNDLLDEKFITWHDNGKIHSESNYASGKSNGKYISYYTNGKVSVSGNYQNDEANGEWSYFYDNGLLWKKGVYKNDKADGKWESFSRLGELVETKQYEQHESYDEEDAFYHGNKLYYLSRLKQDKVIALIYYDKSGKIVSSYGNTEGTFKAKGLFPTGQLQVELEYSNGQRTGAWKYYLRSGMLESVYNYSDGSLHGDCLSYFSSGTVKTRSHYTKGKLDGLYTEYHPNGNIRSIGWFVNGLKQQRWLAFYIDGTIASDSYFLNDINTGYTIDYTEDKKLYARTEYTLDGKIKAVARYDDAGNVSSKTESTQNKHLIIIDTNQSGSIAYKTEFLCGELNGETTISLENGKPYKTLNYLRGKLNGKYTSYYPDGKIEGTGEVLAGNSIGKWKWYNADGSRYGEGIYVDNDKDSLWTYYYYNGKVSNTSHFVKNEKDGESQIFGLDGQLILYKKYEGGDVIAYKAMGKDGKFSDWVSFTGQGEISAYYPNSKIALSEFYKNGKFDGARKVFYPTGQQFSIFTYKNGLTEGDAIMYYPNGKIMEKFHYAYDLPAGLWEYYDESGNLYQREHYISGTLNGDVEFFSTGKKIRTQKFFGGYPVD